MAGMCSPVEPTVMLVLFMRNADFVREEIW